MASKVFWLAVDEHDDQTTISRKAGVLYDEAGFSRLFRRGDLVALKVHFGEDGNHNFIRPQVYADLVRKLNRAGCKAFWTDTNTLYRGRRANAIDHLLLAAEHGYSLEATGIPVIIADGPAGRSEVKVPIDGQHSREVGVAAAVADADALLVLSHATGHLVTGYGGAMKNLGMGLSSRKGKLYQHSVVKPWVDADQCVGDGACARWCPVDAITMSCVAPRRRAASIQPDICIGCGECLAACRYGAVRFKWEISSRLLQERMAEQALAAITAKEHKVGFMNFVMDVGRDCDCLPSDPQDVLARSVGILASTDPVAIDWATTRLLEEHMGRSLREAGRDIDYSPQLLHAQKLGMGSPDYRLIPVAWPAARAG